MNWLKGLKSRILFNERIDKYTTFKIGGKAPILFKVFDLDELIYIVKRLKEEKMDFFIMGNGSNLLVLDEDLDTIFLQLDSDYFKKVRLQGDRLIARAGIRLSNLIDISCEYSLTGLEFLAGIPASLGGAVYMNAGASGRCLADVVEEVKGIDYYGHKKRYLKDQLRFEYRRGNFDDFIITEVVLGLKKDKRSNILKRREIYLEEKRKKQPLESLSAGCIFKNPTDSKLKSAELIERAGLKGYSIGQAQVSTKHANFIVNKKDATFSDIYQLIRFIQTKIKSLYNINLETEIIVLQNSLKRYKRDEEEI